MGRHSPIADQDASKAEAASSNNPILRDTVPTDRIAHLRESLERNYHPLLDRLRAALRSHDDAVAALHDAYLRLACTPTVGEVRQPFAYLYRMAMNLARNRFKRESIYSCIDPEGLFEVPDDAPDPERVALARIDVGEVLALLSERRREIFLSRWRDGKGHAEIAAQFGLHKRTVQKQLARAELLIKQRLDSAEPSNSAHLKILRK